MPNDKKIVEVIGVPSDFGANVRGACMGPSALRAMGLKSKIEGLGYLVKDCGDLLVPIRESLDVGLEQNKYLVPIAEICRELMASVTTSLNKGHLPLVIGGDHSIAVGTISGVATHVKNAQKKMGLIWIDAHADFNVPSSSPTGNIHGMPLATILGLGHEVLVNLCHEKERLAKNNIALIGIRDVDEVEAMRLRSSGIAYFTMRDIDEKGMSWVMKQAIAAASNGTDGVHVSFDIDSVDPQFAPGVSVSVMGGLSVREARLALEMVYQHAKILSLEFVEVNPTLDHRGQTANLCVDLIQSALGKLIV